MKDLILFGDCRESLKTIATSDTKARMCVTSPPYYGLRDYGTATWIGGDPNCNHRRDTKSNLRIVTQDTRTMMKWQEWEMRFTKLFALMWCY